MTPVRKIAGYALNACAFVFGAWVAATALESGAANATQEPPAAAGEFAPVDTPIEMPMTVDYGPHLEVR
jgi:hypothetical protein